MLRRLNPLDAEEIGARNVSSPGNAGPTVRDFRSLIRRRHEGAKLIDGEAADRAELVFNLTRLMNRLGQEFDAMHRKNGQTWAGFRILNVLWAVGPAELRVIARLSGSSRASIWSAVKTLERDGLVQRTRDTRDKRLTWISLTDEGSDALDQAVRMQAECERRWFEALSSEDLDTLRSLMERLADRRSPDPVERSYKA